LKGDGKREKEIKGKRERRKEKREIGKYRDRENK
jgi:hypothetical protein